MRAPTDTERPLACGTVAHWLAMYQELKTMSPHRHWKTDVRLMQCWTRRTIGREDENRLSLDFTLDVLDYYRYCSILLQTIYGLISNPPDQLGMSQTMTQSTSFSPNTR